MNTEVIRKAQAKYMKADLPKLSTGDFVELETVIRDGERQRIQKYKGMIIAISGSGTDQTITVRKISYGVGVEKIFPVHSANIKSITLIKHSKVRRSKLYYMRDRVGKAAMKLKKGHDLIIEDEAPKAESQIEPETTEIVQPETTATE